jgi:hypothetical protein
MMNQQTPSEVFHQVFKDHPGKPFSEIYYNLFGHQDDADKGGLTDILDKNKVQLWHPSLPQDKAVIVAMYEHQAFILRYPDNTYHHLDIGGYWTDETTGQEYLYPEAMNDDEDLSLGLLRDILDSESVFWAYGLITDEDTQDRIHSGEFNELKETLPINE